MSRMKRHTPLLTPPLAACAVLLLTAAVASACPMCKDSVANTDQNVAAGFNNSIYFMLLGFFGCLALVARTIIKGVRSSTVLPGFPVQGAKPRSPQTPQKPEDPNSPTDRNDRNDPGSQS